MTNYPNPTPIIDRKSNPDIVLAANLGEKIPVPHSEVFDRLWAELGFEGEPQPFVGASESGYIYLPRVQTNKQRDSLAIQWGSQTMSFPVGNKKTAAAGNCELSLSVGNTGYGDEPHLVISFEQGDLFLSTLVPLSYRKPENETDNPKSLVAMKITGPLRGVLPQLAIPSIFGLYKKRERKTLEPRDYLVTGSGTGVNSETKKPYGGLVIQEDGQDGFFVYSSGSETTLVINPRVEISPTKPAVLVYNPNKKGHQLQLSKDNLVN